MKELYRNINFYYILAPVLGAIWLLFVITSALPASKQELKKQYAQTKQSEELIHKILEIDPDRLKYQSQQDKSGQFDYTTAIDQFAKLCGIAPSNYTLQGGREIKRSGRKSKGADMTINNTDVQTLAKFLSTILIRWPELQCDLLTLAKLKTGPDNWKVTINFTYYY